MILNFCGNETELEQTYSRRRAVYGIVYHYQAGCSYTGVLAQGENLFITAHFRGGQIGGRRRHPRFKPMEFTDWLKDQVLPPNYCGGVYVAAALASISALNSLAQAFESDYDGRVHGLIRPSEHDIPPPWHPDWVAANIAPVTCMGL